MRYFTENQPGVCIFDSDAFKNQRSVLADPFLVYGIFAVFFQENNFEKLLCLLRSDQVCTAGTHLADQLICHIVHNEGFFFCQTQKVIIKGCPSVNLRCCFVKISSVIYYNRRISGSCTDGLFAGFKKCIYHSHASGTNHQTDLRAGSQFVDCFHIRLSLHGDEVCRTSVLYDCFVQDLQADSADFLCARMYVEYNSISAADHADGVIDDGFCRICRRCNCTDNAKRSLFFDHKTGITGNRICYKTFHTRCLVDNGKVLGDLILITSHTGLFVDHFCEHRGIFSCHNTDCLDNAASVFYFVIHVPVSLCDVCGIDCIVYVLKYTLVTLTGNIQICFHQNFSDYVFDHDLIHGSFSPFAFLYSSLSC